ncbi:hypothetical protein ACLOJK_022599 [Asimina triloba]
MAAYQLTCLGAAAAIEKQKMFSSNRDVQIHGNSIKTEAKLHHKQQRAAARRPPSAAKIRAAHELHQLPQGNSVMAAASQDGHCRIQEQERVA